MSSSVEGRRGGHGRPGAENPSTQPSSLSGLSLLEEDVHCQADVPYRWLVLEGGGVKGIAYGGAVRALEDAGLLSKVEGFSGTSAGSQAAALLAAGFSGEEMDRTLRNMDFKQLLDDSSSSPLAAVPQAEWLGDLRKASIPNPFADVSRSGGTVHSRALEPRNP